MRVIWLSTRFYQCAQLSCAQASPFSRWNKGLRGQTAPPPSIPKNENTKMENRPSHAGSAHFPSGWLMQAKIFFFFFYTTQFSHSSMRRIIRLLRSNFLPRPPPPPFPRGARGSLSPPPRLRVCAYVCPSIGGGRHVISLCGHSRSHASCAWECVHRSPAMMPTVPKGCWDCPDKSSSACWAATHSAHEKGGMKKKQRNTGWSGTRRR